MHNESKGMLLGSLAVIAFGLTLPVTRLVMSDLEPMFIGLGRAVVAAVVAGLWLAVTRSRLPRGWQWARLSVVAAGVVVGFPVLSASAMHTVPAAHGGVVLGVLPLSTALAGALIAGERPSTGFWLVGLAGSVMLVAYSLWSGAGALRIGDLALFGAGLSGAIGYAVGGHFAKELGGAAVICWALVQALPLIAAPASWAAPDTLGDIAPFFWIGFLYLALVSQLFGFFLWNAGLAMGGIARVSQAQLAQPFVTIAASALLLGETINPAAIVFAVLVVSLVALGRRMPVASAPRVALSKPAYC